MGTFCQIFAVGFPFVYSFLHHFYSPMLLIFPTHPPRPLQSQTTLALLPNLSVEPLRTSLFDTTNDQHLAMYVAALARSVTALHDLLINKAKFKDGETAAAAADGAGAGAAAAGGAGKAEEKKDGVEAKKDGGEKKADGKK
jgi:hypothetical protein